MSSIRRSHELARKGGAMLVVGAAWSLMLASACPPQEDPALESPTHGRLREWDTSLLRRQRPPRNPLGPGDPSEVGQWLPSVDWPVVAIHTALLPTGKVLQYAYPSGGSQVWDPVSGEFTDAMYDTDLFCSGHSFLADGMLYVTGGNDYDCQFQGRVETHVFNPFTEQWTRLDDMNDGRWYPTNVSLGDGRTVIFSGLGLDCETSPDIEVYTPGVGLELIGGRNNPLYPSMHLLSDGRIARVGPSAPTMVYTVETNTWQTIDTTEYGQFRAACTSVLIPGRRDEILLIGGGGDGAVTNTCEIIDFKQSQPRWRYTGALHQARKHINAVILPDKRVLLVGGGLIDLYDDPVYSAEIFDPATETWTQLPEYEFPRMYHSTAILLPDARVLLAGQDNGPSAFKAEIYEPSYLFRGERPVIADAPSNIAYGGTFEIESPDADDVVSVSLIAPAAVTHSVNMTQRYVELPFENLGGGMLRVNAPDSGNDAPPGYYMCFLRDGDDVPSTAAWIRLAHGEPAALASLEMNTGQILAGGVEQLQAPDDDRLLTRSGFGLTFIDLHHMQFTVTGAASPYNPQVVDVTVESSIDQPAGRVEVRVLNVNTDQFDLVASGAVGMSEAVVAATNLPAIDYWNSDTGEVAVRVKHLVFVPVFAFQFESQIDRVGIEVR